MLVAADASDDGYFSETVWQKSPCAFNALTNGVRKNCNITQVNRLSDGNFYNFIETNIRLRAELIVTGSNLRSILIEFSSRAMIRIGIGAQVDSYIFLVVYVGHSIVFDVQVDLFIVLGIRVDRSIVFYVQHLSIIHSVQIDRSIGFDVQVNLSIV